MDKFISLKEKVFNIIVDSKVKWNDDELQRISKAIVTAVEINRISAEEGLLFIDDAVKALDETVPLKDLLIEAVSIRQDAKDFDEYISRKIECIPEGVDAAILYLYILGAYNLQVMNVNEFYSDVTSFIPGYKMELMSQVYQVAMDEKKLMLDADYMTAFLTTYLYTEDEVLESYINAVCREISEITDTDLQLLYEKDSEKFMQFMLYSDNEYRSRMLRKLRKSEIKIKALEYGKYFDRADDGDGKVKIESMGSTMYLVADIHEIIFNAYSAGKLEGGSDIILHPDVKERSMGERLRNMGIE